MKFDSMDDFKKFIENSKSAQTNHNEVIDIIAPMQSELRSASTMQAATNSVTYYDVTDSNSKWKPYLNSCVLCWHNIGYSGTCYYENSVPRFHSINSCETWITGLSIAATYKDKGYNESFSSDKTYVYFNTYGTMTLGVLIRGFTISYILILMRIMHFI